MCAPTIVYDFPAQQCALAKLAKNTQGEKVAKRFELYWQGIELANGYWELTCPIEQRQRFECDNYLRVQKGLPEIPINPDLMAASAPSSSPHLHHVNGGSPGGASLLSQKNYYF